SSSMPRARRAIGPSASRIGPRARGIASSRRSLRRRTVPDDKRGTPGMAWRLVDRARGTAPDERAEVIEGLLSPAAHFAPKFFYDELGCALYGAICRLPEYYPTRTEIALFRDHRDEIAEAVGKGRQFVDLGAGDCCKAEGWLPFIGPSRYIAVDIA